MFSGLPSKTSSLLSWYLSFCDIKPPVYYIVLFVIGTSQSCVYVSFSICGSPELQKINWLVYFLHPYYSYYHFLFFLLSDTFL